MNKIINYLRGARVELMKVAWPTRQQTTKYTIEVVVISAGIALFLGLLDYIISTVLQLFLR
ncbi:MAG: preprotein translocase subunit SecE [Candidatus Komeilibacteria bacterium]